MAPSAVSASKPRRSRLRRRVRRALAAHEGIDLALIAACIALIVGLDSTASVLAGLVVLGWATAWRPSPAPPRSPTSTAGAPEAPSTASPPRARPPPAPPARSAPRYTRPQLVMTHCCGRSLESPRSRERSPIKSSLTSPPDPTRVAGVELGDTFEPGTAMTDEGHTVVRRVATAVPHGRGAMSPLTTKAPQMRGFR